jgi:DNA-binding MltR family transcriptional regulator
MSDEGSISEDPVFLAQKRVMEEREKRVTAALVRESDRGCVLVAAAAIDEALEDLLRAAFRDAERDRRQIDLLFVPNAPLQALSAKARIAFALELISRRTFQAINHLRKMRNLFAHLYDDVNFGAPQARDYVRRMVDLVGANQQPAAMKPGVPPTIADRLRFVTATGKIAGYLDAALVAERSDHHGRLLGRGLDTRDDVGPTPTPDEA